MAGRINKRLEAGSGVRKRVETGVGVGYPITMPDPFSRNRPGSYKLCQIRLPASISAPFFQRRHGPYCAKPTRVRSGWPGQGLAKRIWSGSKLVCRNHRALFLAGRSRRATSFPLSYSVPFFHRRPG